MHEKTERTLTIMRETLKEKDIVHKRIKILPTNTSDENTTG